jgi:hypothetical protein
MPFDATYAMEHAPLLKGDMSVSVRPSGYTWLTDQVEDR